MKNARFPRPPLLLGAGMRMLNASFLLPRCFHALSASTEAAQAKARLSG
jgi:hypothetical protein